MQYLGRENIESLTARLGNEKLYAQGLFDNDGFKEIKTESELKECALIKNVWSDE